MNDSTQSSRRLGGLLFVTNSLIQGGSEHKIVRLANALSADGVEVSVAFLNAPDTLASAIDSRVPVVPLDRQGRFSFAALRRLIRLIQSRHITTVVAVNLYQCLYCYLAAMIVGRRGVRLVASVNTTTFRSSADARKMMAFAPLLRRFDVVLFGADAQRLLWSSTYGIGHRDQVSAVLYNGVDAGFFRTDLVSPAAIPGWPASRLIAGSVGRFWAEKNQGDILRAVAILRGKGLDVGAVLVGEGPEKSSLQRQAEELRIQGSVAFLGERRDVRPFLAMMDVFVLPSVQVETFSNAALEAMAMSRPVISTTVGGMSEMLQDGGGTLYAPGDIQALVDHLLRLLTDPVLRCQMGSTGRRIVEERFSLEAMLSQFERLVLRAA